METQSARMYNSDTELLFPLRVIANLETLRGEEWQVLIKRLSAEKADFDDQMAFMMVMVKLCGCIVCNGDSFRAMRGCTQCARQSIKRYKGTDQDLIEQLLKNRREMQSQFNKNNAQMSEEK